MQFIGLAGRAGSGKDTIADYLVEKYGFVKFSFSDALYKEVQDAFGLSDQSLLRDRETKEQYTPWLALINCIDVEFVKVAVEELNSEHRKHGLEPLLYPTEMDLSPRWILQQWGTAYRRAQDPLYWIKKADQFVQAFKEVADPDSCGGIVNTSVRFPNEVEYVRSQGGSVWHIHRNSLPPMDNAGHVSEQPVPFEFGSDKEIHNNSTIERLRTGISLLYTSNAPRIWIESNESTLGIEQSPKE